MTTALRTARNAFFLLALCAVALPGCLKPGAVAPGAGSATPTVLEGERQAYEYAVGAYLDGDYEASARLFGELADTALDPLVGREAFYGLALSRLAGAQTEEEFASGMALWADWASLAPAELPAEDPRLLAPLLERAGLRLKKTEKVLAPDRQEQVSEGTVAEPGPDAADGRAACPDLAEQERLLAASAKENAALKARLKELALENEKLRNQLSALEALHQEILIKKKGFD